jgi:hypothetical protein
VYASGRPYPGGTQFQAFQNSRVVYHWIGPFDAGCRLLVTGYWMLDINFFDVRLQYDNELNII